MVSIAALFVALSLISAYFHIASDKYILALMTVLMSLNGMLYIWLSLAVSVRRAHDLGYSYRENFWRRFGFFKGGFRRGTIGPNPYGPDPLQKLTLSE
jgi:uncharacterized membrane protein YhaH (DUF805 family)